MTLPEQVIHSHVGVPVARRTGGPFFIVMGLVLLSIVIAGFLPLALIRPGGIAAIPMLLHVHGAVFVAWFVLFIVQAGLAGSGVLRVHKRLGLASIALALAMIVLGYLATRGAYAKPGFTIGGLPPAGAVMFPVTDIVNFTIVYSLAITMRRVPQAHKRLMLLSGILIIDPAAARLVFLLGGSVPAIIGLEFMLLGALIVYDLLTRRRPHWASLLGLGLFVGALVAKLTLASTPAWHSFAERLFG